MTESYICLINSSSSRENYSWFRWLFFCSNSYSV